MKQELQVSGICSRQGHGPTQMCSYKSNHPSAFGLSETSETVTRRLSYGKSTGKSLSLTPGQRGQPASSAPRHRSTEDAHIHRQLKISTSYLSNRCLESPQVSTRFPLHGEPAPSRWCDELWFATSQKRSVVFSLQHDMA